MSYTSGATSVPDEQVRDASTKIDGMGPKKEIQVRYRLGISGNIKIIELTKYQIDKMEQMIGQGHVVHWKLMRGERADIERFISISRYRGIRHQDGSPLRGQQTHTNARSCAMDWGISLVSCKTTKCTSRLRSMWTLSSTG